MRLLTICLVMFFALAVACTVQATMTPSLYFAEKVAKADIIAVGKIEVREAGPTLMVGSFLKGSGSREIVIKERNSLGYESPRFDDLGTVIAFMGQPDIKGVATLVGYNGQGLWKEKGDPEYRTDYEKASVDRVCGLIKTLIDVQSRNGIEEQSSGIRDMLSSSDDLYQLAALQWLNSSTLSESLPQGSSGTYAKTMAAFTLPLLKSPNSRVRGYTILLVKFACPSVANDLLLPMLDDKDEWCGRQVQVALGTSLDACGIRGERVHKYLRGETDSIINLDDAGKEKAKAFLNQEWSSKRDESAKKDIARLKLRLSDKSPLARDAAKVYLSYLGVNENK